MLKLSTDVMSAVIDHGSEFAPIEACGYLAEKDGVVTRSFRLTNIDASAEHFSLDPKEQFAAVRQMRAEGFRLRAVYHSHPASPARPSQEDIRLAFDPSLSYVIASFAGDEPVVKSFTIRDGVVAEEEIGIVATIEERR